MKNKKIIGLTPGAENGVGPELMLKALLEEGFRGVDFFWCGDRLSLERAANNAFSSIKFKAAHAELANGSRLAFIANPCPKDGLLGRQAWFLEQGARLGLKGQIDALVTGPINKTALACLKQGPFVGQTEYFATKWQRPGPKAFMAFWGGPFLMSLMTTHIPLRQVAACLNTDSITQHIHALAQGSAPLLNKAVEQINIHILGLNPHAGEKGLLGQEEEEIIRPAIEKARAAGLLVSGPFPADGYFAYFHEQGLKSRPDALVAMYHDQGLVPYKLLSRGAAVNVTMGLALPRTSPAHGTAEELVGTGRASKESTINAIRAAIKLAKP